MGVMLVQIVIEIPDKMYKAVLDGTYCGSLYDELKNGTPLPKVHGRLIDAGDVALAKFQTESNNYARGWNDALDAVIENAPTVIEADGAVKGGKPEAVDHPAHYNQPGKRECIVEMEEDYGPYITFIFCLTSAYKYLYRAGEKPGADRDEDIRKARWYVNYAEKLMNERRTSTVWGADEGLFDDVESELARLERENNDKR